MDEFDLIFPGGPLLLLWASQKFRGTESQKDFLLIFSPYCLRFFNVEVEEEVRRNKCLLIELLSTRIRMKICWTKNTMIIPYISERNQQELVEEKALQKYRGILEISSGIWTHRDNLWIMWKILKCHILILVVRARAPGIRQRSEAISPWSLQMDC